MGQTLNIVFAACVGVVAVVAVSACVIRYILRRKAKQRLNPNRMHATLEAGYDLARDQRNLPMALASIVHSPHGEEQDTPATSTQHSNSSSSSSCDNAGDDYTSPPAEGRRAAAPSFAWDFDYVPEFYMSASVPTIRDMDGNFHPRLPTRCPIQLVDSAHLRRLKGASLPHKLYRQLIIRPNDSVRFKQSLSLMKFRACTCAENIATVLRRAASSSSGQSLGSAKVTNPVEGCSGGGTQSSSQLQQQLREHQMQMRCCVDSIGSEVPLSRRSLSGMRYYEVKILKVPFRDHTAPCIGFVFAPPSSTSVAPLFPKKCLPGDACGSVGVNLRDFTITYNFMTNDNCLDERGEDGESQRQSRARQWLHSITVPLLKNREEEELIGFEYEVGDTFGIGIGNVSSADGDNAAVDIIVTKNGSKFSSTVTIDSQMMRSAGVMQQANSSNKLKDKIEPLEQHQGPQQSEVDNILANQYEAFVRIGCCSDRTEIVRRYNITTTPTGPAGANSSEQSNTTPDTKGKKKSRKAYQYRPGARECCLELNVGQLPFLYVVDYDEASEMVKGKTLPPPRFSDTSLNHPSSPTPIGFRARTCPNLYERDPPAYTEAPSLYDTVADQGELLQETAGLGHSFSSPTLRHPTSDRATHSRCSIEGAS
eukprot:Nk52_evm80s208 gene=Nk52_evmTU80s208